MSKPVHSTVALCNVSLKMSDMVRRRIVNVPVNTAEALRVAMATCTRSCWVQFKLVTYIRLQSRLNPGTALPSVCILG